MILSTHGFIASSIGQVDADAQAFFDRVTTAGGSLSETEQTAVNTLVLQIKEDGIWTKMKAIYPMVGASAAACAQNLKSSSFTGSFSSGWTFASTGVTPNGTSAYMDTMLIPSNELSSINASIGYYGGSTGTASGCVLGAGDTSIGSYFEIYPAYPGYGLFGDVFDGSGTYTANSNAGGFIFAYRNLSTTQKKHSIRGTITTLTENSKTGNINASLVLGARKLNTSTIQQYSTRQHRFAFIGDGLTDTEASDLYTAVQAFQTSLSRQV